MKNPYERPDGHPPQPSGIGLALGGGMARGFAHIGVLKAFERHGIKPSFVAGTSIGAVVGGCYLAGKLAELEEWALSLTRYKVFSYLDFKMRSPGLIGGGKLISVMEEHLKGLQIEQLPCPFITIATDLKTGHEVWIRKGPIIDAMRASFALPGVFAPVERDGRFLIDGALVNPVPVSVCQALGARMTIAVDLNADIIGKAAEPGKNYQKIIGFDIFDDNAVAPEQQGIFSSFSFASKLFRRDDQNAPSIFGVMVSALNIIQDRLTRSRLAGEPPDVHVKPHIGHIGLLEFEKAKELILAGEAAAERSMPKIKTAVDVFLGQN
ncbi:MAG TPA: patatin-like phospholipase family protein [Alphaproteobacteria bacterium]|nr:patatin-like phospholipase family protein [Alphaproteobacteria bacterium]